MNDLIRVDRLAEELGLNVTTALAMARWLQRMEGVAGPVIGGEEPLRSIDGTVMGHMPLITKKAADAIREKAARPARTQLRAVG